MSVRGKVSVRKSRRGHVQVVAREHYLRDDLSCGAKQCTTCPVRCGARLPCSVLFRFICIRHALTGLLYF